MDIREIMAEVPRFEGYLTVDEMDAALRAVVSRYRDSASMVTIGRSRAGRPLRALCVGEGRLVGILVGCPHPNEPVGGLSLTYLAERLAADRALRAQLGFTWYIIPCIEPDSTRLNEGWFKREVGWLEYALNYYRPPHYRQYEWSYPIRYKRLSFNRPVAETQAMMRFAAAVRPRLFHSFHNTTVSGVHFYLSHESPALYEPLLGLAGAVGLPLTLGRPRIPRARRLERSVFLSCSAVDFYELFAEMMPYPELFVEGGTNSSQFFTEAGVVGLDVVSEVPLWWTPAAGDTSPSPISARTAEERLVELEATHLGMLSHPYDLAAPSLVVENPFKETTEDKLRRSHVLLDMHQRRLAGSPPGLEPVSRATWFDVEADTRVHALLNLGQLVRALDFQLERDLAGAASSGLRDARRMAVESMERLVCELQSQGPWNRTPIRDLVAVQIGAVIVSALCLKESQGPG